MMKLVLTTVNNTDDAENLAKGLIERKISACVQCISGIVSYYEWKGTVHKDQEILMHIKVLEDQVAQVIDFIKKHHPYDIPEILIVSVDQVDQCYLDWFLSVTGKPKATRGELLVCD